MNKIKAFKRLQQAALLFILGPVPIGTVNGYPAHIICGRIQTTSETQNKRERLRAYVHTLVLPVGQAWWLL